MSDKELRKLQNQFLETLCVSGFHKRIRDSMEQRLFGPFSPTATDLVNGLYPKYVQQMQSYIKRYERKP